MKPKTLTGEELDSIKTMCDAAQRIGIDWALALSLFPPRNEEERRWKEKMLMGIQIASPQDLKSYTICMDVV